MGHSLFDWDADFKLFQHSVRLSLATHCLFFKCRSRHVALLYERVNNFKTQTAVVRMVGSGTLAHSAFCSWLAGCGEGMALENNGKPKTTRAEAATIVIVMMMIMSARRRRSGLGWNPPSHSYPNCNLSRTMPLWALPASLSFVCLNVVDSWHKSLGYTRRALNGACMGTKLARRE